MSNHEQPKQKRFNAARGHVLPASTDDLVPPPNKRDSKTRQRVRRRSERQHVTGETAKITVPRTSKTARSAVTSSDRASIANRIGSQVGDWGKALWQATRERKTQRWIGIGVGAIVGLWLIGTLLSAVGGLFTPRLAAVPPIPVSGTPAPTPTIDYNIKAADLRKRYTILLMGLDKRPDEEGRAFRTDTIVLLSIDPVTAQVGMLSIPRDVSVAIPGRDGLQPVNTIYVTGELERPGGGPRLLIDVLQYNLGMHIDNYVALTFDAVIKTVDAVGGVEIDVPYTINDPEYPDMNYGYEPLSIQAGKQTMDGTLALKYARTRHQTNDFDRTRRQQQVLLALRRKATQADILSGLVARAPALWSDLSRDFYTDIQFDQALSLAWYIKDLPLEGIKRGSLDGDYIQAATVDGNALIVINRATVSALLSAIFGNTYNQ